MDYASASQTEAQNKKVELKYNLLDTPYAEHLFTDGFTHPFKVL